MALELKEGALEGVGGVVEYPEEFLEVEKGKGLKKEKAEKRDAVQKE